MNNTTNNKSIFSIAITTTKVFTAGLIVLSLIACSPSTYVTSADRNEVITVGDSIFRGFNFQVHHRLSCQCSPMLIH